MISGDCPYDDCDGSLHLWWPDDPPALTFWGKHTCETCGRVFWEHYSRWNPYSLTEAEFLAQHTVNEDTKQIIPVSAHIEE